MAVTILFLASLLAFVLSAICGGGAGLILMPLLGQYLPVSSVPAALSIGTASSSLSRIVTFRSQIRLDVVKLFVPASLPGVWLGSWLLQSLNPLYVQLIMGLFLVSNLTQLFKKPTEPRPEHWPRAYLLLLGFLVGFVSGMTGAVGLLFNSFYLRYGLDKEQIVATRAANEVCLQLMKLVLYAFFGLMSTQVVVLGAAVAVAAVLSSVSMKWVLPRLSFGLFRRLGYTAMVLSGISLLASSGRLLTAENGGDFKFIPIAKGMESKIHWANRSVSFEFVYDEGFEYEQVIELEDLPADKRDFVRIHSSGAERFLLEEVFGIGEHSYELYVSRGGKIEQFDF